MAAVAPKLRLDVRLFDVSTGAVLVTGEVTGAQDDLFGLEQTLVKRLLQGLDAKLAAPEVRSGRESLSAVVKYGEGLDLADKGDLAAAQSKLAEVVRESPDFTRAKQTYTELIKRLRESQKHRGSELDAVDAKLQQHIDAWRARQLSQLRSDEDVMHYFGYLHAHCNLQLARMRRLLNVPNENEPTVWVPPSKRPELEKLERAWLEGAERLIADKREYRKRGKARNQRAELTDEDNELGEQLSGKKLAVWTFSSAASTAIDAGELLLVGRTPWNSDVDRFQMRPAPAQRDPALKKKAEALLAAAVKELPLDGDEDEVVQKMAELQDVRAEGFIIDGKKEDAVAQWQLFLDRYPKSEYFPKLSKKVEHTLLISEEVEAAQKQLEACDPATKTFELAKRIARADGAVGLARMADRMNDCARKQKGSRAFWESEAFTTPAKAALAVGDCPAFLSVREKAAKAGLPLAASALPRQVCDEP
jgi:hypothetical protein